MILDLVLTFKWFDEIIAGRKTIEYRKIKPIWTIRIWNNRKIITHVRLHRGYTMNTISPRVNNVTKDNCPYDGWDDIYYNINLNHNSLKDAINKYLNNEVKK